MQNLFCPSKDASRSDFMQKSFYPLIYFADMMSPEKLEIFRKQNRNIFLC